jgi:hypothetical protein
LAGDEQLDGIKRDQHDNLSSKHTVISSNSTCYMLYVCYTRKPELRWQGNNTRMTTMLKIMMSFSRNCSPGFQLLQTTNQIGVINTKNTNITTIQCSCSCSFDIEPWHNHSIVYHKIKNAVHSLQQIWKSSPIPKEKKVFSHKKHGLKGFSKYK